MTGHCKELRDLLEGTQGTRCGDWSRVRVCGISTDSRKMHPGELFVGLPGTVTDGARYAKAALRRGAAAVLLPRGAEVPAGAAGIVCDDPYSALATAACRLYDDPAQGMEIVGVTGTNGKTTTALLVAHILKAHGLMVSSWTTTLVDLPNAQFRPQWTTPPANELQRFLRASVEGGARHAVMEVSSHSVVQQRIDGVRFAAGIATNFSPDHLDFHGSIEAYREAKHAFIRSLSGAAAAVLNADDQSIIAMREGTEAAVFTFGTGGAPDVAVRHVRQSGAQISGWFDVHSPELGGPASHPFRLPLTGRHNALNAAAAFVAAVRLGVPPASAARCLARFQPPPRRLEREQVGPYVIYNDVAMNEASYDTVLRTLADADPEQLVIVHALRGNRGTAVNARIADIFAAWDAKLRFSPLVVSESRRELRDGEVDRAVRGEEREAFQAAAANRDLACTFHIELDDAIAAAVQRLRPGGTLLLLGTFGMDRGPAKARAMLRARLGLKAEEQTDYLTPRESAF